jgi:hypothetical protein
LMAEPKFGHQDKVVKCQLQDNRAKLARALILRPLEARCLIAVPPIWMVHRIQFGLKSLLTLARGQVRHVP